MTGTFQLKAEKRVSMESVQTDFAVSMSMLMMN